MASVYLSAIRDGGKTLAVKSLTNSAAAAVDPPITELDGYFLVEEDGPNLAILARIGSEDAALRVGRLLGLD